MNTHWLWDLLASLGAISALSVAMLLVWLFFVGVHDRRALNREMKQFNKSMKAMSHVWQDRG